MKFFKVTDEKVCEAVKGFHSQYQAAFDAMLKFSRRQGGNRSRLGIVNQLGKTYPAIIFSEEPDRNIWKKASKDSTEYWVPKASRAAKVVRDEFDSLAKAFPSKWDVYRPLGYEPMANGFAAFEVYGETCVIGMADRFKPTKKQQKQLERISDVDYENLLADNQAI